MLECVLICAILSVCVYVFVVYSRKQGPMLSETPNEDGIYVEGMGPKKKHSKPTPAPAAAVGPTSSSKASAKSSRQNNIVVPSGVGQTAPLYGRNLASRRATMIEELDIPEYGDDYKKAIFEMVQLMYCKSLKSCLEYTDESNESVLGNMNAYMNTIGNLDKLTAWIESRESLYEGGNSKMVSDNLGSMSNYGADAVNSWFN